MKYADVIVDLAAEEVDQVYTYSVPEDMKLSTGQRVFVPFGPRKLYGYVVSLSDTCELSIEKVRNVISAADEYPLLLPELIELASWMRDAYFCTLASAIRLMIPPQLRGGRVREKTVAVARLAVDGQAAREAIARDEKKAPRRAQILSILLEGPKPTAYLGTVASAEALRALRKQGLVEIEDIATRRSPFRGEMTRGHDDPVLTPAQQEAVRSVKGAMDAGTAKRFLLMGVTGSGKTEVYIRLIRLALEKGKGAIVLVPEIALTPQMVDWFRSRFGEGAAVLHSRLSDGERFDEWRRIRRGEARVVVGARSAIFAPVTNLGLIVVDEEHEHTYQSEKRPRYDAREVAWKRCQLCGAPLVLGSATPSIASFMHCQAGVRPENRYELLELKQRVFGRPMPEVEIVDMGRELEMGNRTLLSGKMQQALCECLESKHQAMLLINRRGYATFVSCRKCGYVEKCENCDVSMTYHQTDGMLRCHYCGAERKPPKTCPQCGSSYIKYFGTGTQRVEEAVKQFLPTARTQRMDLDTTSGKDGHERILFAFRRREIDILIGTQMIAKGLDFPDVTLVGVVAADMTLNLPDYRSPERTFQLITQVAGRAGRAEYPGHVIIQTYEPEHYAVKFAARQDYRAFYQQESKLRRRGLYPPFTIMARLLVSGDDQAQVEKSAKELEERFSRYLNADEERKRLIVQMRALEAPVARIKGKSRWQVFIKMYAKDMSAEVLREMDRLTRSPEKGIAIDLEINPANMY